MSFWAVYSFCFGHFDIFTTVDAMSADEILTNDHNVLTNQYFM